MKNLPGILLYGHDEILLLTRRLIFEGVGYQVYVAQEIRQVSELLDTVPIGLIVLCYSLTRTECVITGLIAKSRVKIPTLLITECGEVRNRDCFMREVADARFASMLGPEAMVRKVDALLHIKRPPAFSFQRDSRYTSQGAA